MQNLSAILSLIVALYQAWSIGANDETTAPVVSGRVLTVNQAVLLGSVFGALGAIFLGSNVQETIGKGFFNKPFAEEQMLVVLLSSSIWLTVVSYFGLAASTTHSTIGALVGLGAISAGLGDMNMTTIVTILGGWLISMPIGYVTTFLGTKIITRLKTNSRNANVFEQTCTKALILSTFILEFSRWGNDVGSASGIIIGILAPTTTRVIVAIAMIFGLLTLGRIVVGNVGSRLVVLTPSAALISQLAATPMIFVFAFIGIPLSGTHVMIAAMLGGAKALNAKTDIKLVRNFGVVWIMSFIVPALMAIVFMAIGSATGALISK